MNPSTYPVTLVDVSGNQDDPSTAKKPNLDKIVEAGFLGIGVRCGYGLVKDKAFDWFWSTAKGRLSRLPYFYGDYYSYIAKKITAAAWGIIQGGKWYEYTKDDPGEIPGFLDCEESSYGERFTILNISKVTTVYRYILTEYDRLSGGFAGIYTAPGHLWIFGDWFKDRPLWLAWYDRTQTLESILAVVAKAKWRGPVVIWQFASDGDINDDGIPDGISLGMETKTLDLNVFIKNGGSLEEWSKFCGGTPAIPEPVNEDGNNQPPEIVTVVTHSTRQVETWTVSSADGLNIRDKPGKPSGVTGWMPNGTKVDVLETISSGQDVWARIGQNQYCAIRYNGIEYLL